MARSTGSYFTGTITGTNNVEDLYSELETRIKAFQSNGQDAWEEYDVVTATAGSRDIVYKSLGDRTLNSGAGDAVLYLRLTQTSTSAMRFRGYQDWSDLDNAGSNECGSTSTTNGGWSALSTTQDIEFWGVSNEYEFSIITLQGGTYRYASFGSPKRTHIPTAANGIAFASNSETAGSSVTVELDRDITSNITVGQKVWLYNITATGTSLESATINTATVDAKAAGSITIDTLDNNIVAGAIVGLDPCPMYIITGTTSFSSVYCTNHANGTYEGAISNSADLEPLIEQILESVNDPHPTGLYIGSEIILDDADTVNGGVRGTPEFWSVWTIGTQADQDRMLPNFDTGEARKIFPTIKTGALALAIGPGAT